MSKFTQRKGFGEQQYHKCQQNTYGINRGQSHFYVNNLLGF